MSAVYYLPGEEPVDANGDMHYWWDKISAETISVTEEDVKKAGCSETEGDEYMRAVYRCYSEKLAALLTEAAGSAPFGCKAADVLYCEPDEDFPGSYFIRLAVVPTDIEAFAAFCDEDIAFSGEEYPEAYYCRALFYGRTTLVKGEDGSWFASAKLDRGA